MATVNTATANATTAITTTTWDSMIQNAFRVVPPDSADESMYYGPWDLVLHKLFTSDDGFMVSPSHFRDHSRSEADYTVFYQVSTNGIPVCVVEIKPQFHWKYNTLRFKADEQIRERCEELELDQHRIPSIYFLSCLGRKFTLYKMDTATGQVVPPRPTKTTGSGKVAPPETWWRWDVLHPAGEGQLRKLERAVKDMTDNIRAALPFVYPEDQDMLDPEKMVGVDDYVDPFASIWPLVAYPILTFWLPGFLSFHVMFVRHSWSSSALFECIQIFTAVQCHLHLKLILCMLSFLSFVILQ
jgi:hypothetical protein